MKKIILSIAVLSALPACASKPGNQDTQGSVFYDWHQEPRNLEQVEPFRAEVGDEGYQKYNLMRPQVAGVSAGHKSQVGSFLSHGRAQNHAQYLMQANRGAIASIESAVVRGKTYHRVIVDRPCNGLINQRDVGCFAKGGR